MDDLEIRKRGFSDDGEEIEDIQMKTFKVKYNEDRELLNLSWKFDLRITQLEKLKKEGYTHINDEHNMSLNKKESCPIKEYILHTKKLNL